MNQINPEEDCDFPVLQVEDLSTYRPWEDQNSQEKGSEDYVMENEETTAPNNYVPVNQPQDTFRDLLREPSTCFTVNWKDNNIQSQQLDLFQPESSFQQAIGPQMTEQQAYQFLALSQQYAHVHQQYSQVHQSSQIAAQKCFHSQAFFDHKNMKVEEDLISISQQD